MHIILYNYINKFMVQKKIILKIVVVYLHSHIHLRGLFT